MTDETFKPEIIATSKTAKKQLVAGLRLPENKELSTNKPIIKLPVPEELIIPLNQHIGEVAKSLVKVGDAVLKGQCIATTTATIGANVHAPTSGTITAIEPRIIPHPSGLKEICIVLTADGTDSWCELQGLSNAEQQSAELIRNKIEQAGIVGLGGAGFPTAVKLASNNKIDTLIINAAECEPYISADDMLIRTYCPEVLEGILLLMRAANTNNCIIAIEDNKTLAIDKLKQTISCYKKQELQIDLVVIPTIYPSGSAKQLINMLTAKEVPADKHAVDIGIVMQNVGTAKAVRDAVIDGKPLISRITTLTGKALVNPVNAEILIGTKIKDALEYTQLQQNQLTKLIMGGPMMGFDINSLETPLIKTSNCVIAGTIEEFPPAPTAQDCIRCGYCADVCPESLLPQQLFLYAQAQDQQKLENHHIFDCIECGLCAYVCPSHIPLVNYYKNAKQNIRKSQQQKTKAELSKQRFENRLKRLAKIKQERELKRQQAAEKRKQAQVETTSSNSVQAALARVMAKKTTANTEAMSTNKPTATQTVIKLKLAEKQLRVAQAKLASARKNRTETINIEQNIDLLKQQITSLQQACYQADTKPVSENPLI